MATATTSGPGSYSWADFVGLDEDDPRELLDGDLVEIELPNQLHEYIVALLSYYLQGWARAHGGAIVLASGYKVRVSENRGVMPDLQLYRPGNPSERRAEGLVSGHPDLVVEVISESSQRYDRVAKLQWYAGIGVPEYWLVDGERRILEQLVLADGLYQIAGSLADDAHFRPETFAGLDIPLMELWEIPIT